MPEQSLESSYGGSRVDEMLDYESLAKLIERLTPAPRRPRGPRVIRDISEFSTQALEDELERRRGTENVGE